MPEAKVPCLLSLPLETLQAIIELIIPEDYENFALTCKNAYASCSRFRERHDDYRRRFRRFQSTSIAQGRARGMTSYKLLSEIVHDPIVARYVQSIRFHGPHDFAEWERAHPLEFDGEEIQEAFGNAKKLISRSPYLDYANIPHQDWLDCVEAELKDTEDHGGWKIPDSYITTLLLTHLPNLRDLSLPLAWFRAPWEDPSVESVDREGENPGRRLRWKLMDVLVRRANDKFSNAALRKLERICPTTAGGYDNKNPMDMLAPFLALDTLKEISAGSCVALDDGYTGIPFLPEYSPMGVNLHTLGLYACTFQKAEAARLFRDMPRLKRLSYAHDSKWHGCGFNWSPGTFVDAILESPFAGGLEELQLDLICRYMDHQTAVTTLQPLSHLQKLALNWRYLDGNPVPEGFDDKDFNENLPYMPRVPKLFDLIPPSLESFDLFGCFADEYAHGQEERREQSLQVLDCLFGGLEPPVRPEGCKLAALRLRAGTNVNVLHTDTGPVFQLEKTDERWMRVVKAVGGLGGEIEEVEGPPSLPAAEFVETFCRRHGVVDDI